MLSRQWQHVAVLVTLAVTVMWASGCAHVQIIDRTPSTVEPTPLAHEQDADDHNLAVLAVDFDPPLEYDEIMASRNRGEGITLLVAVENTGSVTERDVALEAELSRGEGTTLILHKQGTIDVIGPGEIKLARFKDTEIPFSYEYQLKVQVLPVEGEMRLADNVKSYDLVVTRP
jgi:hypothetical protein